MSVILETVIYYGAQAMKYFCPFYFLLGIMHSLAGTIRGTGKTVPPMGEGGIVRLALCQRADLHGVVVDEGGLDQLVLHSLFLYFQKTI